VSDSRPATLVDTDAHHGARNQGPLCGVRVLEIAGLGPAPHCGMMLADMGAEVILVERKGANPNAAAIDQSGKQAFYKRGKRSIVLDLKRPKAIEAVLDLVDRVDVLIEGFRPGVMERLGIGILNWCTAV